jgi:hypothetical protein
MQPKGLKKAVPFCLGSILYLVPFCTLNILCWSHGNIVLNDREAFKIILAVGGRDEIH